MSVHGFTRVFEPGQFVGAQNLSEFALGAVVERFHLRVGGFAGGWVTALTFHRFHDGATLGSRFGHDRRDLGGARGVEISEFDDECSRLVMHAVARLSPGSAGGYECDCN